MSLQGGDNMQNEQMVLFKTNKDSLLQVRVTKQDIAKLQEICKFYGINQSQVIRRFINAEYDNIQGHPELKQAMDKMKELTDFIASFNH